MSVKAWWVAAALSLVLAGCAERAAEPAPATGPADAPATAPVADAPATAPDAAAPDVASGAPRNDSSVIHFGGFGPAVFGADEEQVRMAWGRPLKAGTPSEGATCYYLTMDPPPEGGYGIAFMFEEGGFRRYDVDTPRHVAPGDLVVGSRAEDVLAAFAGRIEEMPHKYVEGGRYLVATPDTGGDSRLVFEVDPQGVVTEWRMGLLPQVLYVEGCS